MEQAPWCHCGDGTRGHTYEVVGASFGVSAVDACRRAGFLEERQLSLDCVRTALILASRGAATAPLLIRCGWTSSRHE